MLLMSVFIKKNETTSCIYYIIIIPDKALTYLD